MAEQLNPDGRVALITGANKGIGLEIAKGLAAKGVTVLIGARNSAAGAEAASALRETGAKADSVRIDLTDEQSITSAAAEIEQQFGKLDILVNNAGISPERGKEPSESDVGLMRTTYETNVFGTVAVTNAMVPLLRKSDAGRIVNVSSGLGSFALRAGPDAPLSSMRSLAYNSSKTALNAATANYANEFEGSSLKINSANPGLCATDLTKGKGRPAAEGAAIAVELALVGPDGPNGGFFDDKGRVPW